MYLHFVAGGGGEPKIMKGIKIGKVFFCCHQLSIEITAGPACMDRKSCQYNYISGPDYTVFVPTGLTVCPCRLDQLLTFNWPVDNSKRNTMPIFIPFIIFGANLMQKSLFETLG